MNIKNINSLLKIIPKIGIQNAFYVAWYRFTIYTRIRIIFFPKGKSYKPETIFRETRERENYPSEWKGDLISEEKHKSNDFFTRITLTGPPDSFFYSSFIHYILSGA